MVDDVVIDDVSKIDERADQAPKGPRVISVFGFGKYSSTDIFYDFGFESRNIGRRIFQNEYFSPIFIIGLQRLQKTEKLATEDGYSKKKEGPCHIVSGPSKT